MSQIARDIYWIPWEEPGCEHLSLRGSTGETHALGMILRMRDERHFRCRYELETDDRWRVRRVSFAVNAGDETAPRRLLLESDGAGHWRVDGQEAPDLEGCLDVDIQVTPFTNTLPIRRLDLAEGDSADIRVVYLPVPELTPRPADQRYTCLRKLGAQGGLYRYEGLFRSFTADLPVDADGLVLDYPETFKRSWPL
ncbi:putative glycolipid-binding domain-containing protein [Pelagibius sp. CAU 1746]|uniref:putative glycolipid-binding domain-containing protein n=1 Tax=Pelagibius sp. CAU 1746 TaxID=3140370 RepID=UPI00325BEDD1